MTQDQMELLSDMIADKVFNRLKDYLDSNKTIVSFDTMSPQEFFTKDVDAFGNVKYSEEFNQKDLLKEQLIELEKTAKKATKRRKIRIITRIKRNI